MDPTAVPCEASFSDARLPHRAPLLERERVWFENLAPRLRGQGRAAAAAPPGPLTVGALERALESADPSHPWIAAFVIGRCRAADPAAEARLTDALERSLAAGPDGADPAPEPIFAVEVGMSLVLRGRGARGLAILRGVLTDPDPFGEQYKAAYYLAQTGDPSGWPQLHAAARAKSNQARIMAVRHAIAFRPYDGKVIGGLTVGVRELLVERLSDAEPIVRQEVPVYLEELGISDLAAVLSPIAAGDPSPDVRAVAQAVLDRAGAR